MCRNVRSPQRQCQGKTSHTLRSTHTNTECTWRENSPAPIDTIGRSHMNRYLQPQSRTVPAPNEGGTRNRAFGSYTALCRNVLVVLGLLGLSACSGSGTGSTAYVGATLFDGSGAPPILDAVIIVRDGHIEAIGPKHAVRIPRGAQELRLDGRWVIPGLIDSHAHAARIGSPGAGFCD